MLAGVVAACAHLPVKLADETLDLRARRAVLAFVEAVESDRFDVAYGMLSSNLRERYSPEKLRSDFVSEPESRTRLARARYASSLHLVEKGGTWLFEISPAQSVRLVLEKGEFRLLSLE